MSVEQVSEVVSTQIAQVTEIATGTTSEQVGGTGGKGNRSFKVKLEQNGPLYGRYNGDSPYQAANKALSEIIRNRVKNSQPDSEDIVFYLVESTKNSAKKTHQYVGRRTKLATPVEYEVANGQTIKKEYKNVLRKVKKTVQKGGSVNTEVAVQPTIISTESTVAGATVTISAPTPAA
jgi:hypothetical protein